jgi:integrase
LSDNTSVQRWLCRQCSYRFTDKKPLQKKPNWQINSGSALLSKRQVCELLTEESKNLATVPQQEQAPREGTAQAAAITGKIVEYVWWMKKQGYSETTILGRSKLLKILQKRGADVYDPESVKATIARQVWSEGRKANAVDAYTSLLKMVGGKWEPPRYQGVRKIPFIPTETEVDQLIAGCSPRMGTFLQLLKETGMRSGEAWKLAQSDVDTTTKIVRITPEKNSNPRIAHIIPKLAAMLDALPKTYGNRVFSNPSQPLDHFRDMFSQQRKRIAHKLKNPRILRITFHTLRHLKGTMEYHRTKDILHVMQVLGHKNIKNTLLYVQLAEELFKDQQEYVSKVAKNEVDACALVEAGFEYVCDFNNVKIFKKRKY